MFYCTLIELNKSFGTNDFTMGKNVKCFTLLQKYADIYKKKNAGIKNLINIDINNLLESGIEIFYIQ